MPERMEDVDVVRDASGGQRRAAQLSKDSDQVAVQSRQLRGSLYRAMSARPSRSPGRGAPPEPGVKPLEPRTTVGAVRPRPRQLATALRQKTPVAYAAGVPSPALPAGEGEGEGPDTRGPAGPGRARRSERSGPSTQSRGCCGRGGSRPGHLDPLPFYPASIAHLGASSLASTSRLRCWKFGQEMTE